mmetsp:Transcript_12945/g.21901  ORF Transcript_12945/g.21901 Transcript_12945/m.21901 type:complete len:233 (+) Transcript_12945:31-729(+)
MLLKRQFLQLGSLRRFSSFATPKMVKQLRELTGSPLKDCMKALEETSGDIDKSLDYLRKKGLAEAAKRVDRLASQGLVGVLKDDEASKITMIQLACETDFVAKTDNFQTGLREILRTIHSRDDVTATNEHCKDPDFLKELIASTRLVEPLDSGVASQNIEEGLKHIIAKTQENVQLVKVFQMNWNPSEGEVVHAYVHGQTQKGSGMGKIGSLVHLAREDKSPESNSHLQGVS